MKRKERRARLRRIREKKKRLELKRQERLAKKKHGSKLKKPVSGRALETSKPKNKRTGQADLEETRRITQDNKTVVVYYISKTPRTASSARATAYPANALMSLMISESANAVRSLCFPISGKAAS